MSEITEKIKQSAETFEERIIEIRRTTKVTKGGKNLSFRVLAVVGNRDGKVGVGVGKAREVPDAIRKALVSARKNVIEVPVVKGTIPHEVVGKQDAAKILMKPAAPGTGIIANGTVRAILELAGVQNVLTKAMGSTNPVVMAQATINGIKNLYPIEKIAALRDITPAQVVRGVKKEG
ncbi:30S ribosomal protein S5 [Fervidobacterium pennivorans subsp. shakshaketiis]|uniref:Small ribosomal subunit protein uS5 n=1 Tax=Fervidobacterium pennivorans (strain DSM 9078 / Ven5) TaxID=771875 RepID=H9UD80_FERPD|nr:30S ribosomal protein S5 [Fervidobacterium pennivorans]AFG35473.1 ribosomal protein S5, bacterial/organelle type [Fervidobacterium pennivorans DSM 9078]QIV78890.1 30S ribosomal protein S5 [Fervidobacterium pennivorans subsp. keratinolyticus]